MQSKLISHNSLGFKEFLFIDDVKSYRGPQHHDFFEIQIYLKPVGMMRINEKEYDICRGDIVLLYMFETHYLLDHILTEGDRYCVVLDAKFILNSSSADTNLINLFSKDNINNPVKRISDFDLNILVNIIRRYLAITQEPGSDLLEKAVMYEFLAKLFRMLYDQKAEEKLAKSSISQILMVIEYINANLDKPLSLDELANEVHFSKFYLCRQFKKHTNLTLNQYITNKRINQAKLLLLSKYPFKYVSTRVGFNYYSQFFKIFKRIEGISPSEYIKKHELSERS